MSVHRNYLRKTQNSNFRQRTFACFLGLLCLLSCSVSSQKEPESAAVLNSSEENMFKAEMPTVMTVSLEDYLDELRGIVRCGTSLIAVGRKSAVVTAVKLSLGGEYDSSFPLDGGSENCPYLEFVSPLSDDTFAVFYGNASPEGDDWENLEQTGYFYEPVLYETEGNVLERKQPILFDTRISGAITTGQDTYYWYNEALVFVRQDGTETRIRMPKPGSIVDLVADDQERVYAFCIYGSSEALFRVDLIQEELADCIRIPSDNLSCVQYGSRPTHPIMITYNNTWEYLPERHEIVERFKQTLLPKETEEVSSFLSLSDHEFVYHCEHHPVICFVTTEIVETEREPLTIGVMTDASPYVEPYITFFNHANDRYYATSKCYNDPLLLLADLTTGNAPDILNLSGVTIPLNESNFIDLMTFLEDDDEFDVDSFTGNLIGALSVDDKLLSLVDTFSVLTCSAKSYRFEDSGYASVNDLKQILSADARVSVFPDWMTAEEYLLWICELSPGVFVDYDTYTCDFDNAEYVSLLKFCLEACSFGSSEDDFRSDYDDTIILQPIEITDLRQLGIEHLYAPDDFAFVGFPNVSNVNGSFYSGTVGLHLAIPGNSKSPEAAYQFVRGMFSKTWQEQVRDLPALRETYDHRLEQAKQETEAMAYGVSNHAVEKFEVLMKDTSSFLYEDNALREILLEEGYDFFSGKNSAEEAARLTQDRVSIYLQERK